jgi:branched-chain amino acid transport system substrate-binding protein
VLPDANGGWAVARLLNGEKGEPMRHRFLVLVLVAAACGSDTTETTEGSAAPATTQPAATDDTTSDETTPTETTEAMEEPMFAGPIRLGAAVSDTGKYAREGQDTRQGYDLWLDWVNHEYGGIDVGGERYEVEIVYYDDEGDPDTAASLVEKLVTEDEVDYLLGPYSSGLTMSTSAIAEKYNVIMVEGNGASETIFERGFKNIFAVLTPAGNYTQSALKALADQGATSVVIAYEDTAFPTSVAAGAEKWANEYGLEILAIESYPKDVADVSNIITTFKNADPDVFVGGGHFNDALLFVRAAKEQGWTPDAMVITVGPSNPDFAAEVGTDANFILGPTQWERTMGYSDEYFGTAEEYAQRYEALWGEPPSYQAAESTATALSLHLAIEAAGVLDTDAVRQALYDLDIVTFYGPINFDDTGKNAGKPMGTIQIQDGVVNVVAPTEAAVADLLFPMLPWDQR